MSSRRKPGDGFTFEVQQLREESLGGGLEAEALSGCVVVGSGAGIKGIGVEGREVGFAGQGTSQATDGVLDAALLPGAMGIAEEGLEAELGFELMVEGELGAIVEGDGLAQRVGQGFEPSLQLLGGRLSGFAGLLGEQEDAGLALVGDEDRLAIGGKEHEIGFPMPGRMAVLDLGWPLGDRDAVADEAGGRASFASAPAALELGSRQEAAPTSVVGAPHL